MREGVQRILVVMRGKIDEAAVEGCCANVAKEGVQLAICYELPPGRDGLREGLAAQRSLTAVLRQLRGAQAETIAVFAACQRTGERIGDYATAWGATEVRT